MDVPKQVDYWKSSGREDFAVAEELFENGRFRHALFFAHLAAEKLLKAHVTKRTGEVPPRIHNLVQLADEAGIEINIDNKRFLGELSAYYIQSRYPEEIKEMYSTITRESAAEILKKTEETIQWLFSMPE